MKKKLLTVLLAGAMIFSLLSGCGKKNAEQTAQEAEAGAEVVDTAAEATGDMISDESFAELQEAYNAMTDAYAAVLELYSSDEIAANADIEEVLTQTKAIMDEMGEITQEQITEEDAVELTGAMSELLDALDMLVDGMEVVEEGDFTLLDVTADMIDAAIYVGDEESEMVLSLITIPDGTPMCAMMEYSASAEAGDVACGAYSAESKTDTDGITWTYLTFDDVYTEKTFEMGFGETEAGECYLMLPDGSIYEAEYLSDEEAVNYMGTAAALLSQ